jgi:hypothetical protein
MSEPTNEGPDINTRAVQPILLHFVTRCCFNRGPLFCCIFGTALKYGDQSNANPILGTTLRVWAG